MCTETAALRQELRDLDLGGDGETASGAFSRLLRSSVSKAVKWVVC